jgi:UMF1 family MFS transporter
MKRIDRQIWSWALYDWANSAFTTTIMAAFFPIFFKVYWANPENPTESTFYLGTANSIAAICVAVASPFLGAIADRGTAKKKLLATFFFLAVIMTIGLSLVQQGHWQFAILFYVIATVGWSGANVFYDSLLPAIASKDKYDFVSLFGYALGYLGGGILFLLNVLMYLKHHSFGIETPATAIKISFITVAFWWAIFSIPLFIYVKEPQIYKPVSFIKATILGWQQLRKTFIDLKKYKIVAIFLIAYWLYIDGVDTIVRMAVDYGKTLRFSDGTLITTLLLVQFFAFPAALAYNWIAKKIGAKRAVISGIVGYIVITFFGYFMQKEWHFYFLGILVALFQGGIQALSRSLYSRIIPHDKSAEFFGFYNMLGKFAAVI